MSEKKNLLIEVPEDHLAEIERIGEAMRPPATRNDLIRMVLEDVATGQIELLRSGAEKKGAA